MILQLFIIFYLIPVGHLEMTTITESPELEQTTIYGVLIKEWCPNVFKTKADKLGLKHPKQLTKEETAAIVVSSTMIFGAIMILAFTLFFYVRLRNKRAHEKLQQKMQKASNLERMRRESKFPIEEQEENHLHSTHETKDR